MFYNTPFLEYHQPIKNAIKEGRVLDFNTKNKDDLSVIANPAGVGNITTSSLHKNLAQFKKFVNSFKEANNIKYSDRGNSARSELADLLKKTTVNQAEKNIIEAYRDQIGFYDAEQMKLEDLQRQVKVL